METLLILAITTGARRGELLGLRWDDIDMEHKVLFIRRTLNHIGGYRFVENDPKTKSSRRKIMLPNVAIEALEKHRLSQTTLRLNTGDKWIEHDLIFSNKFGRFLVPSTMMKWFHALLRDAGLPRIRFHDLRHSAATILLTKGMHPKVVQELLGHSSIAMTMDIYSHVMPSTQQDATNKMDDEFNRS